MPIFKKNKKQTELPQVIYINDTLYPLYHPKNEHAITKDVLRIRDLMVPFLLEGMKKDRARARKISEIEGSNFLAFIQASVVNILLSDKYLKSYILINEPRENYFLPNRINNMFLTIDSIISPAVLRVLKGRFIYGVTTNQGVPLEAIEKIDSSFPHFFLHPLLHSTYSTIGINK